MQKYLFILLSLIMVLSCHHKDDPKPEPQPELTIFIHQPYSGLESYLDDDLHEVDSAMIKYSELQKVSVFYFRNNTVTGKLYQKVYAKDQKGGVVIRDSLMREYPLSTNDYTTFSGLSKILSDVILLGKADKVGMVIGCHASGWLPTQEDKSLRAPSATGGQRRIFGGKGERYDTTYKTLAKAIEAQGKRFEFILIDDCYSQNIEVAYELRNATKYLIGSVTEIGANGQEYEKTLYNLYKGNYAAVCDDFHAYYTAPQSSFKSVTMSVVDCQKAEEIAAVVKRINMSGNLNEVKRDEVQVLDGYDYSFGYGYNIFYDFADYINKRCTDAALLAEFNRVQQSMVIKNVYTPTFNSTFFPGSYTRELNICCGQTCSDPCTEKQQELKETAWYKATH